MSFADACLVSYITVAPAFHQRWFLNMAYDGPTTWVSWVSRTRIAWTSDVAWDGLEHQRISSRAFACHSILLGDLSLNERWVALCDLEGASNRKSHRRDGRSHDSYFQLKTALWFEQRAAAWRTWALTSLCRHENVITFVCPCCLLMSHSEVHDQASGPTPPHRLEITRNSTRKFAPRTMLRGLGFSLSCPDQLPRCSYPSTSIWNLTSHTNISPLPEQLAIHWHEG